METQLIPSENRNDILAVGVYPPPITGQSEAFRILVDGLNVSYHDLAELGYVGDGLSVVHRIFRIFRSWYRFFKKCRGKKVAYFSVAQTSVGFLRDLGFFMAAWLRGAKTVAHLHGRTFESLLPALPFWFRKLIHVVYRRLDRVILLSPEFAPMVSFLAADSIETVANGVPDLVQPEKIKLEPQVKILYLSNLIPTKGVIPLIKSMDHLSDHYQLVLAGMPVVMPSDPYKSAEAFEEHIQQTIKDVKAGDRIHTTGVVSGDEKSRLLRECHVLALPTTYETEAQPICVIEAMMAGLPVVVTPTGDLKNMVDSSCGRVIDRAESEKIAQAVLGVTADEQTYSQLSAEARKRALERYSESRHLRAMAEIFFKLMN